MYVYLCFWDGERERERAKSEQKVRPHERKTILAEGRLFPKNGKQSELWVSVARPGMLLSTEHWILLQHNDWFNKHHLALLQAIQAIQVCMQKISWTIMKFPSKLQIWGTLKTFNRTNHWCAILCNVQQPSRQPDRTAQRLSNLLCSRVGGHHTLRGDAAQPKFYLWSRGSPQNVWQEDCSWEVSLFHVGFLPLFCGYKAHNIGGCRLDPPWAHGIHVQSLRSTDSSSLWVHLFCDENPNVYVATKTVTLTLFATFCHKAASGQTSIQFQSCLFGASPRQDRSVLWPQHCCCSTPSQVQDDSIFWRLLDTFWLHQATSSDIKLHQPKKKSSPQQRKKKSSAGLWTCWSRSMRAWESWRLGSAGSSHRLRGKKNEKSFQWELVLPC